MKVDQDTLAILDRGTCNGPLYYLPEETLDRQAYVKVNKVLELAGGKWNRSSRAHVFPDSAEDALEGVIQTGEITDAKKEFQFFETTAPVVNRILHAAQLDATSRVLEPSAGNGAIALRAAEVAKEVVCIELNDVCVKALKGIAPDNVLVHHSGDFLDATPLPRFSHVLMNPPFSKAQDAKHIVRAFDWLEPGGRLVAVASAGVTFRKDRAYQELRDLVARQGGTVEPLPEGSFAASGTMVNTVLIVLDK
jgi:predicted RNA methylase